MNTPQTATWQGHSSQWHLLGAPQKPSLQDGALFVTLLDPLLSKALPRTHVAVLGVTQELVQLAWPGGTDIRAYDHTPQMVEKVWRPHPTATSSATVAPWQDLPAANSHFHAVVGDGSLNSLPSLDHYGQVFEELARACLADALVVIRCFIRPDVPESLAHIKDAVLTAGVGSIHVLKWRLAMSLASQGNGVVSVQAIYDTFESLFNRNELTRLRGWPPEVVATLDAYKGAGTIYTFPTLAQVRNACAPHWHVNSVLQADYELAERCPTLRFARGASPQ